jgi:hypothetical protein
MERIETHGRSLSINWRSGGRLRVARLFMCFFRERKSGGKLVDGEGKWRELSGFDVFFFGSILLLLFPILYSVCLERVTVDCF